MLRESGILVMACCVAGDGWASQADVYNPTSRFTRSLAQLDRVSALCKDVDSAQYATYSILIRDYIKRLYDGKIPYWVLSDVRSRVMDHGLCKWMVAESLIHYQYAYDDYVMLVKPELLPPVLTEAMAEYGAGTRGLPETLGVARPRRY